MSILHDVHTFISIHSTLKCLREAEEAKLLCKECSAGAFDEIVCEVCAVQCHKGHTLIPCEKKVCRCLHKDPTKMFDETNSPEISHAYTISLLSKTNTTTANQATIIGSSKNCSNQIDKKTLNSVYLNVIKIKQSSFNNRKWIA